MFLSISLRQNRPYTADSAETEKKNVVKIFTHTTFIQILITWEKIVIVVLIEINFL